MAPGLKPSFLSARSSWRTSGPWSPGRRSRCIGMAPGSTKTGRPSTVIATWPAASREPRRGGRVTMSLLLVPLACLSLDTPRTTPWGSPYRTVPRTITSVESVLRTTGTVIGEGFGAAVSAATCAGERICRAAAQPTSASPISTANTRTAVRLLLPEIAEMARIRAPLGPHRGRDKANTARGGSPGERGLFSPIGLVGISPGSAERPSSGGSIGGNIRPKSHRFRVFPCPTTARARGARGAASRWCWTKLHRTNHLRGQALTHYGRPGTGTPKRWSCQGR